MNDALKKAEYILFKTYSSRLINNLPMIFIIASPRTGSTLLYQLMINFFNLFYFSNLVNDYFAKTPLVGVFIEHMTSSRPIVTYKNTYGKTEGTSGPSEGSQILKNWFGGEHPSQINSIKVISDKKQHMLLSLTGINKITSLPLIIKNAWNCFRIKELATLFNQVLFIWLRRDIGLSALSDLESRYKHGGPEVWNSATTANYREIQKLPYWEQVVEQQYEYNRVMEQDLNQYAQGRYLELWYEDIVSNFEIELIKIKQFFISKSFPINSRKAHIPQLRYSNFKNWLKEDRIKIFDYIYRNAARFEEYNRKGNFSDLI